MKYPKLRVQQESRQMVDTFKGYNHNLRISMGEFFDMKNMTSDYYPVLSPRGKRGVYASPNKPTGLIAKDALCYVDGSDFVINKYRVEMGLNDEPKQLISMGAYVIIMPDRKWIKTINEGTDEKPAFEHGKIDSTYTSPEDDTGHPITVKFELCTLTGDLITAEPSDEEPKELKNMAYWIDTSSTPHTLKQYSEASKMWVSIATTYIKISAPGIDKAFEVYDGVTISGVSDPSLQYLNASNVIWGKGEDYEGEGYIVVVGILDNLISQDDQVIVVERRMPDMDFITECNNRLWGCKYGDVANGQVVNEIYASKLGDFKNWNCFMGISTDSWVGSCGTDGQFTGAITHLGQPLFFKENCLHKVYVSSAGAHQVQDTACRGVQKGCEKSLAIVNETLFYKARSGVCAYDGSLPTEVSYVFGNEAYGEAVGGAHGNKYYISMKGVDGKSHLFVFDTAKGLWHREDNLHAAAFCSCRGEMYAIDTNTNKILALLGTGELETEPVRWMAQTGELVLESTDMKYISRLTVRLAMDIGSVIRMYAKYDMSDEWVSLCELRGSSLRSFSIPIRPRRCDHMILRIEGEGNAKIYSITKTIAEGSDLS